MAGEPKADRPRGGGKSNRTIIVLSRWAFGIWFVFGLLPATFALGRASARNDFNLNAALGAFGDSFAGVTSLLTTASLLAVAYQLLRDREQRAADEAIGEDQRKHHAELAMIAALIHSRIYLSSDAQNKLSQSVLRRGVPPSSPEELRKRISQEKTEWSWVLHNVLELRRLVERAEHLIGWKSSPLIDPDTVIYKDPSDRPHWGGLQPDASEEPSQ